jgi:sugar lactone lactonase YvrE
LNLPESITAHADGNLYVSLTRGIILRIRRDHGIEPVAVLPLPEASTATGVKVGPDGHLYVASGPTPGVPPPTKLDSNNPRAAVWRVSLPNGEVVRFAKPEDQYHSNEGSFPNDLAFHGADLFVTDSSHGLIWKVSPNGVCSVFLEDSRLLGQSPTPSKPRPAFGVNGIAFDKNHTALCVSNQDLGTIYRIPFQGSPPPALQLFVDHADLVGSDGIAFDADGTLYAANLVESRLVRVSANRHVSLLSKDHLFQNPSSLAFGTTHSDRHTLYVTNFSIIEALKVPPADQLNPGILTLHVKESGLPLP